jgi:hypothetical protein
VYDGAVSGGRLDVEAEVARVHYVEAAREFCRALTRLSARGVPIDPGDGPGVREWAAEDVVLLRALHESLGRMLDARRSWDQVRHGRHRPSPPASSAAGPGPATEQPSQRRVAENSLWANVTYHQPPAGI